MVTNIIANMKLCFPCENYLREKKLERHLKSKTHLIRTGAKVQCQICKSLCEPQRKETHLQSQE